MLESTTIPYTREIGLIIVYAILGGGMKYVDQAYDVGVFNRKIANAISIPGAILMGYLIVMDNFSAMIFFSVILGVAVSKKIDNFAFHLGLLLVILLPILFHNIINLEWFPFGLLTLSALADEYGNDWSDRLKLQRHLKTAMKHKVDNRFTKRLTEELFSHRFIMKLTLLVLVLIHYFTLVYFIAFLAFDGSYKLVEAISFRQKSYRLRSRYHKI